MLRFFFFFFVVYFMQVQKQLKHELFEQLDDIVVFSGLSTQYSKAITRLQLRDIASSMTTRGLIIYPSKAALNAILWKAFWWMVSVFVFCPEWLFFQVPY